MRESRHLFLNLPLVLKPKQKNKQDKGVKRKSDQTKESIKQTKLNELKFQMQQLKKKTLGKV